LAKLDELDFYILKLLEQDARLSYRKIADKLKISVGTVHNRINKLQLSGIIKKDGFLLNLDEQKLGFNLKFVILVSIDGKHTEEVMNIFSSYPEVSAAYHILGEMSAVLICRFQKMEEVQEFIRRINKLPYVLKTTSNTILKIYKEDPMHIISDMQKLKKRSTRKLKENRVPDEIIKDILDAVKLTPTWANMQGVRFIIVDEKDKLEGLKAAINQSWIKSVSCFIVACIEPRKSGINKNGLEYYTFDAAIYMEQIILAAIDKGLSASWIGYFDEEQTKKILNIPKRTKVIAITPIGYIDQELQPQDRKSLEEIVFRNEYGNRWK